MNVSNNVARRNIIISEEEEVLQRDHHHIDRNDHLEGHYHVLTPEEEKELLAPLRLQTQLRIRYAIPLLSAAIIVALFFIAKNVQDNRTNSSSSAMASSSSSSSSFLGPPRACDEWARTLSASGTRVDAITSDSVSDSGGDLYFADAIMNVITATSSSSSTQPQTHLILFLLLLLLLNQHHHHHFYALNFVCVS